jgi:hypothetical protein
MYLLCGPFGPGVLVLRLVVGLRPPHFSFPSLWFISESGGIAPYASFSIAQFDSRITARRFLMSLSAIPEPGEGPLRLRVALVP